MKSVFAILQILNIIAQMPQRVKKFWAAYRDVVLSEGIPENIADWYVRWSEGFAKFIKGKPVKEHTVHDFADTQNRFSTIKIFFNSL